MASYICEICGKQFFRKSAPKVLQCKGCKREAFYALNPGKKEQHEANRKAALVRKYGVDNPSKSKEVKAKLSENAKERFSNAEQKTEILEKRAITNIDRYGCISAMQNPEIKQKNIDAQLASKGYVGWQNKELSAKAQELAHSDEAYEKRKQTSLKHFGAEHHFQNKEMLDKQWESYKTRTGYDHPSHNPEVKHSIKGYEFEGTHFDSSWELAYYIWLRDNKKAFIYHPPYYMEYDDYVDGKKHTYQPDFLVEGRFKEIKGDHFFNEKNEPYNCYAKEFWWCKYRALLAWKVDILRFEEIKEYLRYVKKTYGDTYLRSFKKR